MLIRFAAARADTGVPLRSDRVRACAVVAVGVVGTGDRDGPRAGAADVETDEGSLDMRRLLVGGGGFFATPLVDIMMLVMLNRCGGGGGKLTLRWLIVSLQQRAIFGPGSFQWHLNPRNR